MNKIKPGEAFRPGHQIRSWFGLHTSGRKAGTWVSSHGETTMAAVIIRKDGQELVVGMDHEESSRQWFTVYYRRDLITPVAGGNHFWLTEVHREKFDGVL